MVSTAAGPGLILLREREDMGYSRHWESTIDNAVWVDRSSTPRGNKKRGEERVEGSREASLRTQLGWWMVGGVPAANIRQSLLGRQITS